MASTAEPASKRKHELKEDSLRIFNRTLPVDSTERQVTKINPQLKSQRI